MNYFKITTNLFPQPIICDTMTFPENGQGQSLYITNWNQYWDDIKNHRTNDKGEINRFCKYIPVNSILEIEILKGE